MPTPSTTFERFQRVATVWIDALDRYTPEQLIAKPADDGWSMGQIYNHLIQTALRMQFREIDACLNGIGTAGGSKTLPGRLAFAIGSIPPIKIKGSPSREYTPEPTSDVAGLKLEMRGLIDEMRVMAGKLEKAGGAIRRERRNHPALGMLNAAEWYRLVEMHHRHHLRQKRRLDAFLGVR
ncbi:MAG: DinB family protein [Bacteroidota bacterium]